MWRWLMRCFVLQALMYTGMSDLGSGDWSTFDERLYPFGSMQNDERVPSTDEYVRKCFAVNVAGDGLNFRENIFNTLFICRNGIVRFKNDEFQPWPINFGLRQGQENDPVIAPYWSRANVNDSFLLDNSLIYYHIYQNTSNSDQTVLLQVEEDVKKVHGNKNVSSIDLAIVITWVNLRPENRTDLENTFQLVLISSGCNLFAIFNYGTIEWSVPASRSMISLWTNYVGKPVIGWNAGRIGNRHEFFNVKNFSGTVNADLIEDSIGTLGKGQWIFSIGGCSQNAAELQCLEWQKSEPTVDQTSLNSSFVCPCNLAQIQNDGRFYKENISTEYNKTCYLSNFHLNGHGQRCCFSSMHGLLLTDPPHAGSVLRFHPRFFPTNHKQHDKSGFDYCCRLSNFCKAYFERRKIGNCSNYQPPKLGLVFGDPQFYTFDGMSYTFNGAGEFILTKSPVFQVQIRTQLVGKTAELAVRAVVAREINSPSIQVSLDNSDQFEVEVDGILFGHFKDLTRTPTTLDERMAISKPNKDCILVVYPLGNSIKVTKVIKSLSIVVASTNNKGDHQNGLLGLLNGNKNDDFTMRNNSRLPSTNPDDQQIHYKFGLDWQVSSNESLFHYKNGTNVSTFSIRNFTPVFASSFSVEERNAASILCNGEESCMYDYLARNSTDIGLLTLRTIKNFKQALLNLYNSPPRINFPQELILTVGERILFNITAVDDESRQIVLSVSGLPRMDKIESLSGVLQFTWTANTTEEFTLEIMATDSNNASTLLRPIIKMCACKNGGKCVHDLSGLGTPYAYRAFYLMGCSCPKNVNGRFCQNSPADLCSQGSGSPCFPTAKCRSTKNGIKCGKCPDGYVEDGTTCTDIDECLNDNGGCDQLCENTPGSYRCRCQSRFNQGYKLGKDGKTCEDIDECTTNAHDCHQNCINTIGSFTCSCQDNFKVDSTNPKLCKPTRPCQGINNCQQQCFMSDNQEVCSCNYGYHLHSNRKSCIDTDECTKRAGGCQHSCENSEGSFECSCLPGFLLDVDGKTCRDYDECTESINTCDSTKGQRCVNLVGGYKCECDRSLGFYKINGTCQGVNSKEIPKEKLDKPYTQPGTNTYNSLQILIKNYKINQWTLKTHTTFRKLVSEAITGYCSGSDGKRSDCGLQQYGRVDFNELHVNRLPGYPKQEGNDLKILFYVRYPKGIESTEVGTFKVLPSFVLGRALREHKQYIEMALKIDLDLLERSDGVFSEKPKSSQSHMTTSSVIVVSLSVAGALFLSALIVGFLIRRINGRKSERNSVTNHLRSSSIDDFDDFDAALPDVPPLY